jgi:hypothetical protein
MGANKGGLYRPKEVRHAVKSAQVTELCSNDLLVCVSLVKMNAIPMGPLDGVEGNADQIALKLRAIKGI